MKTVANKEEFNVESREEIKESFRGLLDLFKLNKGYIIVNPIDRINSLRIDLPPKNKDSSEITDWFLQNMIGYSQLDINCYEKMKKKIGFDFTKFDYTLWYAVSGDTKWDTFESIFQNLKRKYDFYNLKTISMFLDNLFSLITRYNTIQIELFFYISFKDDKITLSHTHTDDFKIIHFFHDSYTFVPQVEELHVENSNQETNNLIQDVQKVNEPSLQSENRCPLKNDVHVIWAKDVLSDIFEFIIDRTKYSNEKLNKY